MKKEQVGMGKGTQKSNTEKQREEEEGETVKLAHDGVFVARENGD